jgi:hypothetical protein
LERRDLAVEGVMIFASSFCTEFLLLDNKYVGVFPAKYLSSSPLDENGFARSSVDAETAVAESEGYIYVCIVKVNSSDVCP